MLFADWTMFAIDLRAPDTKSHIIRIFEYSPTAENRKAKSDDDDDGAHLFVSASLSHPMPVGKSTNRYIVSNHRHRNRMEKLSHASPKNIWVTGRLSTILIHISCTFNSQREDTSTFDWHRVVLRIHIASSTTFESKWHTVERTHCIFSFLFSLHCSSFVFPTRPWKRTLSHTQYSDCLFIDSTWIETEEYKHLHNVWCHKHDTHSLVQAQYTYQLMTNIRNFA